MWTVGTVLLILVYHALRDDAMHRYIAWGNLIADDPVHFVFMLLITTLVVRLFVRGSPCRCDKLETLRTAIEHAKDDLDIIDSAMYDVLLMMGNNGNNKNISTKLDAIYKAKRSAEQWLILKQ